MFRNTIMFVITILMKYQNNRNQPCSDFVTNKLNSITLMYYQNRLRTKNELSVQPFVNPVFVSSSYTP